jgi:hypothetical protein
MTPRRDKIRQDEIYAVGSNSINSSPKVAVFINFFEVEHFIFLLVFGVF